MPVFVCTRHSTAFDRSDVAFYNISARKQHILKASDAEVARTLMKKLYPDDQEFHVSIATKEQVGSSILSFVEKKTCERCNETKDYTDAFFFVSSNTALKFCRQCMNELALCKKKCPRCRQDKPMSSQYWHAAIRYPDGFRTPCKVCFNKAVEARKAKKRASKTEVQVNE